MATFVVTESDLDDYDSGRRFKTRPEADQYFESLAADGQLVRLIRWDWVAPGEGRPTELRRHPRGAAAVGGGAPDAEPGAAADGGA